MMLKIFILFFVFCGNGILIVAKEKELSAQQAKQLIAKSYQQLQQQQKAELAKIVTSKKVRIADFIMPFHFCIYGKKPLKGYPIYISLHGGGQTSGRVNDQQWRNQQRLYQPKVGIYIAPRAPTNTWNLWHQAHIDKLLVQLITAFASSYAIDFNRIYLLGYSAGGDGVYQLAPRLADFWAAAAMMAGHPNDAQPNNLLNTPIILQCGNLDTAYQRNEKCQEWGNKLSELQQKHGKSYYQYSCIIYPNLGHWMELKCRRALPWLQQFKRRPWPKKIIWQQQSITTKRLFWLVNEQPKKSDKINAEVNGQVITIGGNVAKLTVYLHDDLINLNLPIVIKSVQGKVLYQGKIRRDKHAIIESLKNRLDPTMAAMAQIKLLLK